MSGAKGPETSQWNTQVPSPESSDAAPPDAPEWQTLIPAHLLKDDLDSEACKTLVPLAAMELSFPAASSSLGFRGLVVPLRRR